MSMEKFGAPELPALRQFDQLTPVEKIRAILAVIREPVTKEDALDLANIEPEEEDAAIAAFTSEGIILTGGGDTALYILDAESIEEAAKTIDLGSASDHIGMNAYREIIDYLDSQP